MDFPFFRRDQQRPSLQYFHLRFVRNCCTAAVWTPVDGHITVTNPVCVVAVWMRPARDQP